MIKNIIEAIRKDEKFSFEKIIENNIMTDDEYFEFLKFVFQKNQSTSAFHSQRVPYFQK